jgi:gliding motility-associated-like protein
MKRILLAVATFFALVPSTQAQIKCTSGSPFNGYFNVNTSPDSVIYPSCTTNSAQLNACGTPLSSGNYPIPSGSTTSYAVDTITTTFFDTTGSTYATMTNNTWNNTNGRVDLNTLSFDFMLYGKRTRYIHISDNGYLKFGNVASPTNVAFGSTTLPSALNPRLAIFGHFRNFDPTVNANNKYCWKVVGTAPRRALVFSFIELRVSNSFNTAAFNNTFQIILYETTNNVEVITQRAVQINSSDNAICGLQDTTGGFAQWALHYSGVATNRNFTDYSLNTLSPGLHVRFTPNGATNPYSFDWFDVTAAASVSTTPSYNLTGIVFASLPRKYVARISYTNPVTSAVSIITDTITLPAPNIIATLDSINTRCLGTTDGIITVNNVSGGTAPYTYAISPTPGGSSIIYTPSTSLADTIKGLPGSAAPGTAYTVTITDANGCTKTFVKRVLSPSALTITAPPGAALVVPCVQTSFSVVVAGTGGNLALGSSTITFDTAAGCIKPTPFGAGYTGWTIGCTYTITMTDIKGCTGTKTLAINQPPIINITSTSKTDVLCGGGTTGTFSLTRTGGYSSSPPPPAGSPWFTYAVSPIAGTLVVTPTPGSPGTFAPNHTTSTATWSSMPVGNYTATITDARGCTRTSAFAIDSFGKPAITFDSIINARCFGETNAKVYAKATSITTSVTHVYTYTYTLQGGTLGGPVTNTTGVFTSGLGAGTYTLTATDNKTCTSSTVFAIAQPALLTISTGVITQPLCNSGTNGSVTYTSAGGNGSPLFTINPSAGTTAGAGIFEGLADSTTYVINVTDSKGCSSTVNVPIVAPAKLLVSGTMRRPKCIGDSNGVINLSHIGGTALVTYTATPAYAIIAGDSLTNVPAGEPILVTATDANGCVDTQSFIFINPPLINATAIYAKASCYGICDAGITLAGIGGTGNAYEYSINGGPFQTSGSFTNLCATADTFSVRDSLGCVQNNLIFNIQEPGELIFQLDSVKDNTCSGAGDGKVWFTVLGGTPPFTFSSLGTLVQLTARTFRIDGLGCDGYFYTVNDSNSCTAFGGFSVGCPFLFSDGVFVTDATCHDSCNGSANINTLLGGLPYAGGKYDLVIDSVKNNEVSCITTPITYSKVTSVTLTGLSKGDYYLRMIDSNLCSSEIQFTITQPDSLQLDTVSLTNTTCHNVCNGSAIVTATGGSYNFAFNGKPLVLGVTNDTMQNLCATTVYTAVAVDQNNCKVTRTFSVAEPPQISLPNVTVAPLCNTSCNGKVKMNGTGGTGTITYSISPSAGTSVVADSIFGLCGTTIYTITGTDANACFTTTTVQITPPTALGISYVGTDATCYALSNGSAVINVTGGTSPYTYAVNPNALPISLTGNNLNGLGAGANFTVTATDNNNCSIITVVSINQPTQVTATLNSTAILCYGANSTIKVTASGGTSGYTYALDNPTGTYINADSFVVNFVGTNNTYTVWVKDANSCSTSSTINITQPTQIIATSTASTIACYNGNSTIKVTAANGTGAYTYAIGNPAGAFGAADSFVVNFVGTNNTYTLWAKDANNCSTSTTINITQPTQVTASATSSAIPCNGNTSTIKVLGANGTGVFTYAIGSPAGTFSSVDSFVVNVAGTSSTFTVWAMDANSCSVSTTIVITQPSVLLATASATAVACNNGTSDITITGSGGTVGYSYSFNNTTYNATNVQTVSSDGIYTVYVQDANNCTASSTVQITKPSQVTVSASNSAISCFNIPSTITVVGANGTGPVYKYAIGISPAIAAFTTTNTFVVTVTGTSSTYTVWTADANNCSTSTTITITQPDSVSFAAPSITPTCSGSSIGQVVVSANGGPATSSYLYIIAPAAGTQPVSGQFIGLGAGTYTITAASSINNCPGTTQVTINANPLPVISVVVSPSANVCAGDSVAFSTTSVPAATSLSWAGGPPSITDGVNFEPAVATTIYTVTATSAAGCTDTKTQAVTSTVRPAITIAASPNDTVCAGGAITLTASGPAVSYSWSAGPPAISNGVGFAPLAGATTYTVEATDALGCTSTASQLVFANPALSLGATNTNILCNGGNSTITGTAAGGTGPYTYASGATAPAAGSYSATNTFVVTVGTYTLWTKDALGCTASVVITVTEPTPVAVSASATAIPCNGDPAIITAVGAGGTSPFEYSFVYPAMPGDFSVTDNLAITIAAASEVYTITARDFNGCTITTTITITQPSQVAVSASATQILCRGGQSTITAAGSGGTSGYQYALSATPVGFATTDTFSVSVTGTSSTYTLWVQDANTCQSFTTITITQPATSVALTIDSTKNPTCIANTGCIYPSASGGTGAITFSYGPVFPGTAFVGSNYCLFNAGTYTVWAQDINGCSTSASTTLTNSSAPNAVATVYPVTCFGTATGCVKLDVTGGTGAGTYTYLWNCSASTTDSACGLLAGPCLVEVIDAAQCTTTVNIVITEPALLVANIINADSVNCFGASDGSALATASGGKTPYSYLWSNSNPVASLSSVTAGQYIVTVTDSNLCTAKDTVDIFEPNILAISAPTVVDALCKGDANGSVTLSATGGTPAYTFSPAQSGLAAGTYNFKVVDVYGCRDSIDITINEPANVLTAAVTSTVSPTCVPNNDGCINVSATGGNTGAYNYTSGATYAASTTVTNFCTFTTGTYTIWSTDSKGCTASTTATLINSAAPSVTLAVDSVSCFGFSDGIITATASGGAGGYTYSWTCSPSATNVASGLPAGSCTITVTDMSGCTVTANTMVDEPAILTLSTTAQTNVLCKGGSTGSASVTAGGGTAPYSYVWTPNVSTTNSASGLSAGAYDVVVTDANNCTSQVTINIAEPSTPFVLNASNIIDVSCFGGSTGSVTITPSGGTVGLGYVIATLPAQSGLPANTYTYTAVDGNNCPASTIVTITQPINALSLSVSSSTSPTCTPGFDGCINVTTAGGTGTYSYSYGVSGSSYAASSPIVAGNFCIFNVNTYTVWVTDGNSCTASTNATLNNATGPTLTLTVDSVTCFGACNGAAAVSVSGGTAPYTYAWSCPNTSSASDTALGLCAGPCSLIVTDDLGCSATENFVVPTPAVLSLSNSSQTNILCNGGSTGAAAVSASGGVAPYSYVWTPNVSTTNSASGLSVGSYTVNVTDANNCTSQVTINIAEPSTPFVLTASNIIDVSCFGGSNGSVTITASGGTIGLGYVVSGTPAQSGLSANTYTYTAVDGNNCPASTVVTITEPLDALMLGIDNTTSPTCTPGFDGCINVVAQGGAGAYSYSYGVIGANYAAAIPIVAGNFCIFNVNTYTVWVTDGNNCTASTSATLNNATGPTVTVNVDSVTCFGACTGGASLVVSGGNAPYTYAWTCPNTSSTSDTALGLCAGPCSVIVSDQLGCSTTANFTVPTPTQFVLDTTSATGYNIVQPTSAFATNGKLTITGASGGTPPYQYIFISAGVNGTNAAISGVQSSNVLLGIAATDTILVLAIDAKGCLAADTIKVPITAPTVLGANAQVFDEYCIGLQNGEIIINTSGSVGPYTYSVVPSLSAPALSGSLNQTASYYPVAPGVYTITVTADNGDTVMVPAFVAQALALNVSTTPTNPTCLLQGSINVNGSGGAGGLTSVINNSAFTISGPDAVPINYTNLPADTYTIITTDLNGCADTSVVVLTNPTNLVINNLSTTQAYCVPSNNACVGFNVTGAAGQLSASINGGPYTNFTTPYSNCALSAGSYTIIIRDASNNCTNSVAFNISTVAAPMITIDSVKDVLCATQNNGAVYYTVSSANPFAVTINGNPASSTSVTGLVAGNYSLVVTDNVTGCTDTATITITQPTAFTVSAIGTNPTIANVSNGTITGTAAGGTIGLGYQYSINGGAYQSSGTFINLDNVCYTITALDANGCTSTTSVCLVDPGALVCNATIINGIDCNGNTNAMVSISANGGVGALTVSGPSVVYVPDTLAGPFGIGTYQFIVSDVAGAICTTSIVITQPTALTASIASSINPGCVPNNNGSVTASASGGTAPYTFAWPSAGITNSNLIAGGYTVTVTDDSGCTATASVTLITTPSPSLGAVSVTNATCANPCGSVLSTNATGGTGAIGIGINPLVALNALCADTTYTITATDTKGCTSTTTVQPTVSPNPTASISATTVALCAGDSTGTVIFNTNASAFTASITGTAVTSVTSQAGSSFTGLKAGNFAITIVNTSTGCSTIVNGNIAPTASLGITGTTVNTSSSVASVCDGQINVNITNGAATYTVVATSINYTTTATIASAGAANVTTTACAGTYTLTVTDANGCASSTTVVVLAPGQLICNVSNILNVSCFGGNNGSAQITGAGGVAIAGGNYTWTINNGGTISAGAINPATASSLSNGAYIVTVTDANNVASTCAINITQPIAAVTSTANVATAASCITGATVNVSGFGGTPNYTLVWNGSSAPYGTPINNVAPGTYTYSITDANLCSVTGSVVVNVVALPSISSVVTTEDQCGTASNTGTITITASSANGGLLYGIGTTAGAATNASNILNGNQNGTYTVIVKDALGCTSTSQAIVPLAPNPIITNIATTNASCVPGGDGTITVTANSGVAINSYATTSGAGTATANVISALAASNYIVVVTDANNCTVSSTAIVNTANAPTLSFVASTLTKCNPSAVGSFTLTTNVVSGGSISMLPNIGSIINNAGSIVASNLPQGTYTVTVKNNDSCVQTLAVVISTTPAPQILSTAITHVSCNGDSNGAFTTVTSVGSYTATITSPGWGSLANNTGVFTILPAAIFNLIIVDSNGCKDTSVITVTEPPVLTASAPIVTKITCNGNTNGTYTTLASGGTGPYMYTLSNSSGAIDSNISGGFTGLPQGTYSVAIRDAQGCLISNSGIVQDVPAIVFAVPTITNPSCFGFADGKVCITATGGNIGGLTYSGGTYLAGCYTGLSAGSYTFTATDGQLCNGTTAVTLTNPASVVISVDSVKHVQCFAQSNGAIYVSGAGGQGNPYNYNLNAGVFGSSGTFNNLVQGTYTIIVRDANLCPAQTTVTITQPTLLSYANFALTHITCNGSNNGTVTPGATGGTTPYTTTLLIAGSSPLPLGSATSFTGMAPGGIYTIATTDANGCTISTGVTLTEPAPLVAIVDSIDHIACFGGTDGCIRVVPPTGGTPPYQYSYAGPTTIGQVTIPSSLLCGLAAGTYTLFIKDSNGCNASTPPVTITEPPLFAVSSTSIVHVRCFGDKTGEIALQVTGGTKFPVGGPTRYSFVITGPTAGPVTYGDSSALYTNLGAGNYNVLVTDANGCTTISLFTITQNNQIVFDSAVQFVQPRCFNETNGVATIYASGGVSPLAYAMLPFQVNPSTNNVIDSMGAGTYTIVVQDAVGCTVTSVFVMPQPDPLIFGNVTLSNANCINSNDGVINVDAIGGNGSYLYSVVPGVRVSTVGVFGGVPPGVYTVNVIDRLGCEQDTIVTIDINPNPIDVNVVVTTPIVCQSFGNGGALTAIANGGTAPYSYIWSNTTPVQTGATAANLTAGLYNVLVMDATGCTGSTIATLRGDSCCEIYVPNVFTPNGDNLNEIFRIVSGADITLLNFSVVDRWGNRVFQTNVPTVGWNGRINNIDAEVGSYYWVVTYVCLNTQETLTISGDVMLAR